jgi:NAD-dependent deacetylase
MAAIDAMILFMDSSSSALCYRAREVLDGARSIAILTGAGISAESGIQTFRDAQTGLWSRFRPEDLATADAFSRDPKLVWEWYAMRRERVRTAKPNAGHVALAALEARSRAKGVAFLLATQNVDGLHQAAGSRAMVELHGNIGRVKCFDQHHPVDTWPVTDAVPPPCPECGSPLRPDVVWFDELLPREALQAAIAAARSCDAFLCIGTSTLVQPAASLPFLARENGATVIEVNPGETTLTASAQIVLRGAAGEMLPLLIGPPPSRG